jgi:hypothetical protein
MSAEHEVTELRCALTDACDLLNEAVCPNVDCKSGVIKTLPWGRIGADPTIEPCNFCVKRQRIVDEHG